MPAGTDLIFHVVNLQIRSVAQSTLSVMAAGDASQKHWHKLCTLSLCGVVLHKLDVYNNITLSTKCFKLTAWDKYKKYNKHKLIQRG